MRVTQVAIQPTEASRNAGRPALTPELLAASGARYSRNNEGLERILARVDPHSLDRSVDSIFRMIDYGHQSIADMVPVAIFIDGISIWLAYYVWVLSPTAGGQESSTRYLKLCPDDLVPPADLGIAEGDQPAWRQTMEQHLDCYARAHELWESVAAADPEIARIPRALLNDTSEKAARQVSRMRRNYAFDRARYFLPLAASTNMMLLMSARAWVRLCQHLLSHPASEARRLGEMLREELALAAPRMLKHAETKPSIREGILMELAGWRDAAAAGGQLSEPWGRPPDASLEVYPPDGTGPAHLADALRLHDNRYAWMGSALERTLVRFRWSAMAFGEIRDLNRHRTGTRYAELVPCGFYAATDQLPRAAREYGQTLDQLEELGGRASRYARERLQAGDPLYVYQALLGTQFPFEHSTTADKFIYEGELRTGVGAHYRYAQHLHDALSLWDDRYPETRGLVLEGFAEPE